MPLHDIPTGLLPGQEIGYDQITSNVTVSATSSGSGTLVVQGSTYVFDGHPVIAEFFCASVQLGANDLCIFSFIDGSTEQSRWGDLRSGGGATGINPSVPLFLAYRFTPTAGPHTYKVTAIRGTNNATVTAGSGSGGAGTYPPCYLRFIKA